MVGVMATVAVLGVGAIGSVTAAALERAGKHELVLCTRRALKDLGVETPGGVVVVRGRNLTEPSKAMPVDWVMVCTKAYDAESTAAWFKGLCGPQTKVAVLQNGVEHRERFSRWVAAERLLPVIIDCPAEKRDDGSVLQRAWAKMVVEESALGREFAELFTDSGALTELTADFTTAAWKKLCLNSQGALSAMTKLPNRVIAVPGMEAVALEIVRECGAVARAAGATIEDGFAEKVIAGVKAAAPEGVNSMLADRLAGRPMEVDARNGAIVRFGERLGVETPLNAMAVAVLRAMQS
jgi:2-dehydropantoate 2-reductase